MLTATDGEMRWTAILSTDMVDFAQTTQDIGSEQVYALLQHVLGIAREVIEARNGQIVDTAGDGLLAAFGAPHAVEAASAQVCLAAFEFHARLSDQADALKARFGIAPLFRSGIAGGNSMIVRQQDAQFKVVGDPVNLAARLQSLAGPGEVLLTDMITREAEGFVRTSQAGTVEVKGFKRPITLSRLTGIVESPTRFDRSLKRGIVDLVSRQSELSQSLTALGGQDPVSILLICGVAGIGKSRLVHEIGLQHPGSVVLTGQCAPGGQSENYGVVFDLLAQLTGQTSGSDRAAVLKEFQADHPDACSKADVTDFLTPAASPSDVESKVLRDQAFLVALMKFLAKNVDALVVIEDAHWIDPASSDLLAILSKDPLPLVVTCRPTFDAVWSKSSQVKRLDLAPLLGDDIREMIEAQLGGEVADSLGNLITEKSEGIPLIAEEIIRALDASARLQQSPKGLDLVDGDSNLVTGNLEHLVLSRVDALSDDEKSTLQVASAIGRDFSQSLLEATLGRSAKVHASPGLVEERSPGNWRFAHALIRDAVYGSLLASRRKAVHFDIAEALEGSEAPNGLLAQHFIAAEAPERAVPYMIASARDNLNVYALEQVHETMDRAMQFIEVDPDIIDQNDFSELSVLWMRALEQRGDFRRSEEAAARILPRLGRDGYTPAVGIVQTHLAMTCCHTRDYKKAEQLAKRTLADAEAHQDELGMAYAKMSMTRLYEETYWRPPEFIEGLVQEILPVAEANKDRHLAMSALYQLSSTYRSTGRMKMSIEVAKRIQDYGETHNDLRAKAYGRWARAIVYSSTSRPEAASKVLDDGNFNVIKRTADDTVSNGIMLFVDLFMKPPDTVRPKIIALREKTIKFKDYNMIHSLDWLLALLEFKAGNIATGLKLYTQLLQDAKAARHVNVTSHAFVALGEIHLTFCGLMDPEAEAPADRPTFERAKPGLADFLAYVRLRFFGLRKAKAAFEQAIELFPTKSGGQFGRVMIGLGLIAKARGNTEKAKELLSLGLKEVEAQGMDVMIDRARKALSD